MIILDHISLRTIEYVSCSMTFCSCKIKSNTNENQRKWVFIIIIKEVVEICTITSLFRMLPYELFCNTTVQVG